MKKHKFNSSAYRPVAIFIILFAALASCVENNVPTGVAASPGCSSDITDNLPNWFGGTVTNNGFVTPQDGATFDAPTTIGNDDFCSFQAWSARMFLWLTSPTPRNYGGFGRVFNSKDFYAVSDKDLNGLRSLVPQNGGNIFRFNPSMTKKGPNRLPMQLTEDGQNLELVESQLGANKLPLVFNRNAQVEVSKIERKGKTITLIDARGTALTEPKALFVKENFGSKIAQLIRLNGQMVGLTSTGNLVSFGLGQADSNCAVSPTACGSYVLMSQNGSLVYYQMAVNAVYANFLSMVKIQGPTNLKFPTTTDDLLQVKNFASSHYNTTLTNAEALAVEIKTSWVEANFVQHPEEYITMAANVPDYDTSNPMQWVLKPNTKPATLALVGMHVVGSVQNHPKMVWATFEHKRNTPNVDFQYQDAGQNTVVNHDDTTSGSYLFSATSPNPATINQPTMYLDLNGNIVPMPGYSIQPTNLQRDMPWGSSGDLSANLGLDPKPFFANPIFTSSSDSMNSHMIAVNTALHGVGGLDANDVRRNYNLIGTTWITGDSGQATPAYPAVPNWDARGRPPKYPTDGTNIGTNQLSNSTMESFNQTTTADPSGNNCLTCHVVQARQSSTAISHIFDDLQPLP